MYYFLSLQNFMDGVVWNFVLKKLFYYLLQKNLKKNKSDIKLNGKFIPIFFR